MVSILPLYVTLDKKTFTSLNTPILIPVSFHSYVYGATNRPLKYTDSPMRIQTAFKLILICQYAGYNSDYEALKLKLNTIKQSHWAPHSFGVHVISNRVYAPFVTTKKKQFNFVVMAPFIWTMHESVDVKLIVVKKAAYVNIYW